jgi:hypothetical protein
MSNFLNIDCVTSPTERDLPGTGFPGLDHDVEVAESPLDNQSSRVYVENVCVTTTDSTSGSLQIPLQPVSKTMSRRQIKTFLSTQENDFREVLTRGVVTPKLRTLVDKAIDTSLPLIHHPLKDICDMVILLQSQSGLVRRIQSVNRLKISAKTTWDPLERSLSDHVDLLEAYLGQLETEGLIIPPLLKAALSLRAADSSGANEERFLNSTTAEARAMVYGSNIVTAIFGNSASIPMDGNNSDDEVPDLIEIDKADLIRQLSSLSIMSSPRQRAIRIWTSPQGVGTSAL